MVEFISDQFHSSLGYTIQKCSGNSRKKLHGNILTHSTGTGNFGGILGLGRPQNKFHFPYWNPRNSHPRRTSENSYSDVLLLRTVQHWNFRNMCYLAIGIPRVGIENKFLNLVINCSVIMISGQKGQPYVQGK